MSSLPVRRIRLERFTSTRHGAHDNFEIHPFLFMQETLTLTSSGLMPKFAYLILRRQYEENEPPYREGETVLCTVQTRTVSGYGMSLW